MWLFKGKVFEKVSVEIKILKISFCPMTHESGNNRIIML